MKKQSTEVTAVNQPVQKLQAFFQKVGKRNLIIACAALLIGAAVWLNFILFSNGTQSDGFGGYDQPSGNISDSLNNSGTSDENSYFSATLVSRQKARDEALEVLQSVVDNVEASETVKNEALAGISAIADEMQKEANIESLIMAKGFEKCVAVLNGDTASIIVSADSLQPAQIAQINAVVYEQTGIAPTGVTIINK